MGWIDNATTWPARIGADPLDDEELRQKKALLVVFTVIILPVSLVWGALTSPSDRRSGILPFIYLAVSVGSLVIFARTRRFQPLLVTSSSTSC